jgi:hypothetical protein
MGDIVFDGSTMKSREVTKLFLLGSSGDIAFEASINCRTTAYTVYTDLVAKAGRCYKTVLLNGKTSVQSTGTAGTLVINGSSYSNCYIENISAAETPDSLFSVWDFTVNFVRETI